VYIPVEYSFKDSNWEKNMAALSDYLESGLLSHIFRGSTFAKPSNISIALTSSVPLDSDSGSTIPELPSGVQKGNNFVSTNYARINLGNPSTSGNTIWNSVGIDNTTIFSVYGTSSSGHTINMSGYFYPLYLSKLTSDSADQANTLQVEGFSDSYRFKEFPNVLFYSPVSLQQSGKAIDPGYTAYEGNGFIKNSAQLVFNTALTDWGWISGVAVVDSSTYSAGNLLMYAKLENPRYVYTGDNIKFDLNSLEISLK
jgi:hypothetical protein